MISVRLSKSSFFDSAAVVNAVDAATRKVFSRFGAFVRQRAKASIRKAPKIDLSTGQRLGPGRKRKGVATIDAVSDPGDPPFSHVGTLRKLIYFGYDTQAKSVVIGPEPFNGRAMGAKALEYGGEVTIGPTRRRKARRVTIGARPFMRPAFEEEQKGFMSMWQDAVK